MSWTSRRVEPTLDGMDTPPIHHCGSTLADGYDVVSRHRTTEGVIVYARCRVCEALQVRLERPHQRRHIVAESRHADVAELRVDDVDGADAIGGSGRDDLLLTT